MAKATPTVSLDKALEVPREGVEQKSDLKVYKFSRTISPRSPLDLLDGTSISFHCPFDNVTNTFSYGSFFETTDVELAEKIRAAIKDKPWLYVFEN